MGQGCQEFISSLLFSLALADITKDKDNPSNAFRIRVTNWSARHLAGNVIPVAIGQNCFVSSCTNLMAPIEGICEFHRWFLNSRIDQAEHVRRRIPVDFFSAAG